MMLVSACLAGVNCRYNGENKEDERIVNLVMEGKAIPVCPEQLGGLTTPRKPAEIINGKIMTSDGEDFSEAFLKGAEETLRLCKKYDCNSAIFQDKSPSCGCGLIYDGSFSGNLIEGDGITTSLLKENGIKVTSSAEIE